MDRLRKQRAPIRSSVTRIINAVVGELEKVEPEVPDKKKLQVYLTRLRILREQLQDIDQKILDAMLDADVDEAALEVESTLIDEHQEKISSCEYDLDQVLTPVVVQRPPSVSETFTTANSAERRKKTYKLPKVEVKQFNGNILDWLSWWQQFERIHLDDELHAADKFQYLSQAMVDKSKAAELIKVYPQTAANYPKAVQALKDRFGKPKILKRVYVRELLNMINNNSRELVKISSIYDRLEAHLKALESLGVTPDQMDVILFPMVESCLPEEILVAWQRSPNYGREDRNANPPLMEFDYLLEFIKQEVENENQREMARSGFKVKDKGNNSQRRERKDIATASSLINMEGSECLFCARNNHGSSDCYKAKKMTLEAKREAIKTKNGCFRCLKRGHLAKLCKVKVACSQCKGTHLQIMCPNNGEVKENATGTTPKDKEAIEVANNSNQISRGLIVLLKTLHVKVRGNNGTCKEVRLLFDDGSQRSYVKTAVAKELECKTVQEIILQNNLFGGVQTKSKHRRCYEVELQGIHSDQKARLTLIDEDVICSSCPTVPKGPWIEELAKEKIFLTDTWSSSPEVEILIGSDLWGKMMTGKIKFLKNGLIAMESIFGWTLSGEVPSQFGCSLATTIISMTVSSDKSIQDMWSLEAIGIRDKAETISNEEHDQLVKKQLEENISRGLDGRYQIKLPWMNWEVIIPTNRKVAESRLFRATAKLNQQGQFHLYDKIFKDWEAEGIIEVHVDNPSEGHYLPHRPVFKPESLTTPVRPVFDASCKTGKSPSLNQCLEKGPNMLELIPSILLRFRSKIVGVVADIRKAFQMVGVSDEDRNYQKFLWWEDDHQKKLKVYRHSRVVFGLNCSPFILAAVIDFHLNQIVVEDQALVEKIRKALYVDNVVTSVDTEEQFEEFRNKSVAIFQEAKMELRCWESSLEGPRGVKPSNVLGLRWNKDEDTLGCQVPELNKEDHNVTKRKVLSVVSQIYDPIGFSCPVTLQPKILLQDSWAVSMDWDEEWGKKESKQFQKWIEELEQLSKVQIPRHFGGISCGLTLHLFCDASKNAYAAAVFARSEDSGVVKVNLLLAKTRLAPLDKKKIRSVTIPRLELMGCCIGARLLNTVKESLNIPDVPTYNWSDSTVALAWIKRNEDWGTFVGNRVKEINRLTQPSQWKHVPGHSNPADLPSRGCSALELLESRWWEGPKWLYDNEEKWPNQATEVEEEEVAKERKKTVLLTTVSIPKEPKFSSYLKNVRVSTWIRRFVANCRLKPEDRNRQQFLSMKELSVGELDVIKEVQLRHLKKLQEIKKPQTTVKDGIIHVNSRVNRLVEDTQLFKSPMLLPKEDTIVHQLISYVHRAHGHAGTQFVLGKLREKYWILQGRRTVSRIIHKCTVCRRHAGQSISCNPTDLPKARIEAQYSFQTTGVDLAGPLILKGGKKAWIIIYTCAVYRGVYLDITNSLSTEEFMDSLEKFTWIIGRPTTIYSDNGTNFVGTANLLKKVNVKKLHVDKINWIFNPPTAAWWGGWWERLVRTLKDLLRRMIGTAKLSQKELEKCLASISHTINNRPLTTVTEDPDDLTPLTPAMFMKDAPVSGFPEGEEIGVNHLRENYKKIRNLRRSLNNRFRKEYLSQLVQNKNEVKTPPPKIGDVVLVGSNDRKRFEWPMGRIIELYPGQDKQVRVAKVKTASGILIRPLQRLYPLEVTGSEGIQVPVEVKQNVKKKSTTVKIREDEVAPDEEQKTRYGRTVKTPIRYSSWNK